MGLPQAVVGQKVIIAELLLRAYPGAVVGRWQSEPQARLCTPARRTFCVLHKARATMQLEASAPYVGL